MVASRRTPAGPDPRLYAALLALPDRLVGEIVNGRLIVSPRPSSPHAHAALRLGAHLMLRFGSGSGGGNPGGWWILGEPELHLGSEVLVPDLAGWRQARLPQLPDVAAFTLAPDWICEVLSESTRNYDRTEKLAAYARAGVRHAWLVDPRAHTLEVYRSARGAFRLQARHSGRAKVKAEPFQAVELELALLWLPGSRPKSRRR